MNKKISLVLLVVVTSLSFLSQPPKTFAVTNPTPALHPAGTLVQNGGTVWQINEAGTGLLSIDSQEKFYSNRLSFNNVVNALPSDLALPVTGALPWGDGVLFADHAIIYQVSGGQKHGFISADIFLGQGFSFPQVRNGNLSALVEGSSINNATSRHLAGTLVSSPTGAIFLQSSTGSTAFPSSAVFFSQGGKFADVIKANAQDNTSNTQIANYRTGSIVNDSGALWVTKQNTKIGFPTATCFLNFGFTFTIALTGSTAGLSQNGTTCADNSPANNSPTSSYSTSTVVTTQGNFIVKMESFNLASNKVRVITDTAADKDCLTDCPVASLSAYLTVNNGQHGMNGTYFCPTAYPDCAGKTNSFFWKVLDSKLGIVINANNGLGDEDPFITFDSVGQAKYFHRYLDYKDSGLSASAGINAASLIEGGTISLNYSKLDTKQSTVKGTQGAMAVKGQTLYLIHVYSATVPDEAAVLQQLGMDYAILLDGGGSDSMMYENAYKSGPGRNIPNAVVVQVLP